MAVRDWLGAAANVVNERASVENPIYPLTATRLVELLGGPATDSGEQMSMKRSLTVIAFYRAVQIISGIGAICPLPAYTKDSKGNRTEVTDRFPVLTDPHPEMTALEWYEWLFASLEIAGNAYFLKRRFVDASREMDSETGMPVVRYLLPIRPELVRVGRTTDGQKWFEIQRMGDVRPDGTTTGSGEVVGLTTKDVLHVPGYAYDGVVGLSPVDMARQGLASSLAAERYAAQLFGRGALMSGILQTDRRLPPGAADALRDRFQEMAGGLGNAHKVAVLDQGAKFSPLQLTPEDSQLLETRQFNVIEVARLTGVPAFLLMETSAASNWGTGIEQIDRTFLTYTMLMKLGRVGARFTKEILPRGVFAKHDTSELQRADILTRFRSNSLAIRDGYKTRAEARRDENWNVDEPELEKFLTPMAGTAVDPDLQEENDALKAQVTSLGGNPEDSKPGGTPPAKPKPPAGAQGTNAGPPGTGK